MIPKDVWRNHPGLLDWVVGMGYRGSIAHGMYIPSKDPNSIDDKDVMAIVVPPKEYYIGLKEFGSRGTVEITYNEWDVVVYEARKFIHLLMQGNPNVLMMLWLPDQFLLRSTPVWRMLIDNRPLFVGKHVYQAFTGYAHGQLHRMTHYKFEGYMGEKRKALVDKYGYDCKNAAHLIRLLRMGAEFLSSGELHVLREDATQLLEIKTGQWTLDQVKAEAEAGFRTAEQVYHASRLPERPNRDAISNLCASIIETVNWPIIA